MKTDIRFPISITAAARHLHVSRITASKWVNHLGIGTRIGDGARGAMVLGQSDFVKLAKKIERNSIVGKFQPGNDLWKLGRKSEKSSAISADSE